MPRHSAPLFPEIRVPLIHRSFALSAFTLAALWAAPAAAQRLPAAKPVGGRVERQRYSSEVLREYSSLIDTWQGAWRSKDLDALTEPYTDDAVVMLPGEPALEGKAAIEAFYRDRLATLVEARVALDQFDASGSLAYTSGRYLLQTGAEGEEAHVSTGTYVAVLVTDGRSWKLASQAFHPDPVEETSGSAQGR